MRLLLTCMTCRFDPLHTPRDYYVNAAYRDDMRYEITCDRGHTSVTVVQEAKYEILFEIGVNAIADGYYREAVASFASALERFLEFAIGALLHANRVSVEEFRATWKHVSTSSERQLGAFAFLWLGYFGQTPQLLNPKHAAFRNDVVHKGRIPEREEAIDFGNNILAIILPKLQQLHQEIPDAMAMMVSFTLQERRAAKDATQNVASMTIPTIFRMARSKPEASHSVATHLDLVLKQRINRVVSPA